MRGQVAPRAVGVLMGLQGSRNPFSDYPLYQEIAHLPLAERLAIMRVDDFRERLLAQESVDTGDPIARRLASFAMIFPLGDPPNYAPSKEDSIAAQAVRQGRRATEVAYEHLLADDGRGFLFAPVANYQAYSLDVCREMLASENTLIGLGDGGAHVSFIADASYPTFLLSYWGRDRGADRFDLAWLVKRHTSDNAAAVGLPDRGLIAPGMMADLNIIDMDALALHRPSMVADLPAGGNRLLQKASGYVATVKTGRVTYRDGEATGALTGMLVRGPRPRS